VRRMLAVLAVTVAVVVALVSFRTHPVEHANPSAALKPPGPVRAPARRRKPATPGVRTAVGYAISTPYTTIQVQATLTHGRLTAVRTVTMSGNSAHTKAINRRAEPLLRERVLRAHSADVDVVSGATGTSTSFLSSLQSAILRAGGE
jgi:uncharacterized protein with FMN-binding domain